MTDAEGIRNLVGTGLVQLVGGLVTAGIALGLLFYLNWRLTTITLVILLTFGGGMAVAFKRLRPLFRERGKINAEVTGRLGESLGGIRIVKSYIAEKREEIVFTQRRPSAVPERGAVDHGRVGHHRVLDGDRRRDRRADDRDGRARPSCRAR